MIAALAAVSLAACSDDDNNYKQPEIPDAPVIESTSVDEGSEVNAAVVNEITVTYNAPVTLNSAERIMFNGRRIIPAVVEEKTLSFAVALEPSTDYELSIPEKAVIADKGLYYGPALTLKFRTMAEAGPAEKNYADITNPSATQQARNVYAFLVEQSGQKVLSGAMANVNNNNTFADWIYNVSGKYPALTGYDFIHMRENYVDYTNITPARTQWENNGLVSYMWHWMVPDSKSDYDNVNGGKYGFYIPGAGSETTEFDIREALKEGTWQHECILKDIDQVAGYFKLLSDAGIPVLWRPLHEAAGNYDSGAWFWWGRYGLDYTKQLWKLMHDRLVGHHGLNNIIWIWTAQYAMGQEEKMKEAYPGDEYVDIVGVDLYPSNNDSQLAAYVAALNMTEGRKLVALSEVGRVPDPKKCIQEGAAWSWFMEWYTYNIGPSAEQDEFGNTRQDWVRIMNSPFVMTREQMPSLK